MKRFLSILLTIAMVLSLTVPAFAETTTTITTGGTSTQNVTASYAPTEAKWGTKDDLTVGKGTLAQAFAAAKDNSAITYIQLQKNVTATSAYRIYGGEFTLDWNGYTLTNTAENGYAVEVSGATVAFTDNTQSKNGGITSDYIAVAVEKGKVTFEAGVYQGVQGVVIIAMSADWTSNVTINGGTYTAT